MHNGIGLGLTRRGKGKPAPFTVTISGTGAVGEVLTVADFVSFDSVQWTRNGSPIALATGSTYTLVEADAGTAIRCEGTIGADTVPSNAILVSSGINTFDGTGETFDSSSITFDEAA